MCIYSPDGKEIYATHGADVVSIVTHHKMQSSDHEEADTILLIHIIDVLNNGHKSCKTVELMLL